MMRENLGWEKPDAAGLQGTGKVEPIIERPFQRWVNPEQLPISLAIEPPSLQQLRTLLREQHWTPSFEVTGWTLSLTRGLSA